MIEVEAEIALAAINFEEYAGALAAKFDLPARDYGLTKVLDVFLDTPDLVLLKSGCSLRVRQKLEAIYSGGEYRLTFKRPVGRHPRLFVREETKVKLMEHDLAAVIEFASEFGCGLAGTGMANQLVIDELSYEREVGPEDSHLHLSYDRVSYLHPATQEPLHQEHALEIEEHGKPSALIIEALDWTLDTFGFEVHRTPKYERGMTYLKKAAAKG
jgi:hypothetical protein